MKIRNMFLVALSLVFAISLIGCAKTTETVKTTGNDQTSQTDATTTAKNQETWTVPDLSGYTTAEAMKVIEESPLTNYKVNIKQGLVYGDAEGEYKYDMFYEFAGKKPGDEIDPNKKINIYFTAKTLIEDFDEFFEVNSSLKPQYEKVVATRESFKTNPSCYKGKSFLDTGLGEVTVTSYVDGDTTRFKDYNGTQFTLRYLGVNTPESTYKFEAWGKAASAYTENCLKTAKTVVLEAEAPGDHDGNGRLLGWVWYEDQDSNWHLLNLEQIMLCYTTDKADSKSVYSDLATSIGVIVGATGRRVWGEADPGFDYSTDPKEITIQELMENFPLYYSRKVKITGIIAITDNKSPVIVDPETGYGVYYYIAPWSPGAYDIVAGNKVSIIGVATFYGSESGSEEDNDFDINPGSPQLTDFAEANVTLISEGNSVDPTTVDLSNIKQSDLGKFVELKNLTVTRTYEASTGTGLTVYCTDANGNEISIRIDASHKYIKDSNDNGVKYSDFSQGTNISSVIGYLTVYYGNYQLNLISADFYSINK